MTNTLTPSTVTPAASACTQPRRASSTNHTTWTTTSNSHGMAAPIAQTKGAFLLGGWAGSTRLMMYRDAGTGARRSSPTGSRAGQSARPEASRKLAYPWHETNGPRKPPGTEYVEAMGSKWTAADVPDQSGRVAVITGANTGLGYETAAVLAGKGAHVVLAVRNPDKGKQAAERITASHPGADVTVAKLELTSLDDIRTAAGELRARYPRIDLLINNAGVMYTDKGSTKDGFESQLGTNHLGHFALTGLLLDNILPVDGSRVVTVSSVGHRIRAKIHFDDLQLDRNYNRVVAYGQSKLANLLFTYELARRLKVKGAPTIALAAHPGAADTELLRNMPGGIKQVSQFVWSNFIA